MIAGLKAVAASLFGGRKLHPELPDNIDTTCLERALSEANDIASQYIAQHRGSDCKTDVMFILSERLKEKPVRLNIVIDSSSEEKEPDVNMVLTLPMSEKECDRFVKRYKKLRKLSVLQKCPFCIDGETQWFFALHETGMLTDFMIQSGLNSSARWTKKSVKNSVTHTEIS